MQDIKSTIKELISNGDPDKAFEVAKSHMSGDTERINDLILLQGRFADFKKALIKGILPNNEATIERNHICNAFLGILSDWNPGGQQGQLYQAIKNLHIDPDEEINEVHLFNCDRRPPKRQFRKAFDTKNEDTRRFQFYFICADRDEKPDSLARGLIWEEIVREEIGDLDSQKVNFVQTDAPGRIKPEKLPMGSSLSKSIDRFKAYVQKRFSFADSQSFEIFMETGVPKLPYQYVTAIFDLNEDEWEDSEDWDSEKGSDQRQYFEWMINRFQCAHKDIPTFVFFFVIYIQNLHQPEKLTRQQKAILQELETIGTRDESTMLKELLPVKENDLETWLYEIGDRDPNAARKVVLALVQSLEPEERKLYENQQRIHMKDIEIVQRIVYQIAKEK